MANKKRRRIINIIINSVLIIVFLAGLSLMGLYFYDEYNAKHVSDSSQRLAQKVTTIPKKTKKVQVKKPTKSAKTSKSNAVGPGDFNIHWNQLSSNIKAWIYIPGTNINYPILQAKDNTYYLNYNLYGQKSVDGEIFFDYRQKPDFSEYNTFIYGHDLYDGTHFSELNNFYVPSYFNAHKRVYVYTRTKRYDGTAFAIEANSGFSKAHNVSVNSQKALTTYVKYLKDRSVVKSHVKVSSVKKMISLWTCSEHQTTGDHGQIVPAEKSRTFVSVAIKQHK